jgi:putative ABC transport system substrate-binding protein
MNMWKKFYPPLIFVLLFSIGTSFAQEKGNKKTVKIGVTQFVSNESLENDQRGFETALAEAGFKEKVHVLYDRQNARGDLAQAEAIARKYLIEKFDLIHTIAPPTSQAVVRIIKDIPIVFSSVADPVQDGLVPGTSLPGTRSGTNVTGVSHRWPASHQFELSTQFIPKAKKWGTIYNLRDPNSHHLIKEIRGVAKKLGMELIEVVISNSSETSEAAQFLAGKVQAIHLVYDETVLSSLEAIVKVCNERKIPLLTSDLESVPRGAVAAYGLSFFSLGNSAGKMGVRILKGEEPGNIPWGQRGKFNLYVNERAARAQGVVIPHELLKKSDKIISQ